MVRSFCIVVIALFLLPIDRSAAAQGTGLVFLEPDRYRSIPLAPPTGLRDLPPEMDLSGDFPTPGDQGSQGSCVGWAVGYALKSFQERRERQWTSWDDTRRMSPAFIYNQVKVGGCKDGARIADALDLLTSTGSAAWSDQPYSENACDDLPSALARQNAGVNRVAAWFRVNPQDRQAIKSSIAAGIPVVVGMRIDDRFNMLRSGQTWRGGGIPGGAHAMVVVGYSDSRDAVKVINSWGTDWGDGGFGWIDFGTFRAVTREAYVAQDVVLAPGFVERKEHPYEVKSGPYGPTVFGVQLGMSRAQLDRSLTRRGQTSSIRLTDSETRDVVKVEATDLNIAAEFWIDPKYDFVERIETTIKLPRNKDPMRAALEEFINSQPPERLSGELFETVIYNSQSTIAKPVVVKTDHFCRLLEAEFFADKSPFWLTPLTEPLPTYGINAETVGAMIKTDGFVCESGSSWLGFKGKYFYSGEGFDISLDADLRRLGVHVSFEDTTFNQRSTTNERRSRIENVIRSDCYIHDNVFYNQKEPTFRRQNGTTIHVYEPALGDGDPLTSCKAEVRIANYPPTLVIEAEARRNATKFVIE